MIIRAIRLYNFGVYAGEQVIEPAVKTHDSDRSVTLIGGLNGRGKTSLLDALLLALYGRRSPAAQQHRYGAYLASLIHRNAPKDDGCWVELDFEVQEGFDTSRLQVRRSWRASNVRTPETLTVTRDGKADPYLVKVWDTYVEELIPLGLASLFFFDGEKISALAEAEETPEHVQRAIRSMLGLDIVDRALADLSVITRRRASRLKAADLRAELDRLVRERARLEEERLRCVQSQAQTRTILERKRLELQRKQQDYRRAGDAFFEQWQGLKADQERLVKEYADQRATLVSLAGGPLPLLLSVSLLDKIHDRVKVEADALQAQAALPVLRQRNQELSKLLQGELPESAAEHVRRLLTTQELELEQISQVKKVFPLSPIGMGQLEDLLRRQADLKADARDQLELCHRLELHCEQVERALATEVHSAPMDQAMDEYLQLNKDVSQLEQQLEDLTHQLASIEQVIKQIDSSWSKLGDRVASSEEEDRVVRFAAKSKTALERLRVQVTEHKIAHLTNRICKAFETLTHKTSLFNRINLDPTSLRITLVDEQGREVPKARLSSGEKQMLSISILWGLAQASGLRSPVIVDTPVSRLDASHRLNFVTKYLPQASHQVMVLSTDTEIVGPYLRPLEQYIGRRYLLHYDDDSRQTRVQEGYFAEAGD